MMLLSLLLIGTAPAVERQFRCEALEADKPVRHFSFGFVQKGDSAAKVKLVETDRVFTPGNIVATFSTRGGGTITEVPSQRPGKWSGSVAGQELRFELAARDGSASFTLAPDAAAPGRFTLAWKADRVDPQWGNQDAAAGTGSCTEISSDKAS